MFAEIPCHATPGIMISISSNSVGCLLDRRRRLVRVARVLPSLDRDMKTLAVIMRAHNSVVGDFTC